jgi:hypothetical protein
MTTFPATSNRAIRAGLFAFLATTLFTATASAQIPVDSYPWPATDALGRSLPMAQEVGPPRRDRFVGIFYFLWHNDHRDGRTDGQGPRDISQILSADPDALHHPDSPLWGPVGSPHYWGKPLWGYYLSTDPWVLRRHSQLLAAAGVDTLIFDTTNAQTYPQVYRKLCQVFAELRQAGYPTPQIVFMVNTQAGKTAERIYHDLYQPGLYRELWFMWQGKPLLICDPKQANEELRNFFTLRAAHWPFRLVNTPYAWHWETTYPQVYGYTDDPKKPEEVIVSVAQNLRASDGRVTNMSDGNARGRSFHDGAEDTGAGVVNYGYNFAEQWKRALSLDPPFVMVTGWNEWIAGRFSRPGDPVVFVDQYNQEFSRDIEPMSGGHGDNHYYQLVANVRRFKGAPPISSGSAAKSIDVHGGFEQWQDVRPEFLADSDATRGRDYDGSGGLHYVSRGARNALLAFKIARDRDNIYFYARTHRPLTPRSDPNWMWLLIHSACDGHTGWEDYDYIVNRTIEPDGSTWLEKNVVGGWKWQKVTKIQLHTHGDQLQLAVPRSALGLRQGNGQLSLDFKWVDEIQHPGDVKDFYVSGDVAPTGRFIYRYQAR